MTNLHRAPELAGSAARRPAPAGMELKASLFTAPLVHSTGGALIWCGPLRAGLFDHLDIALVPPDHDISGSGSRCDDDEALYILDSGWVALFASTQAGGESAGGGSGGGGGHGGGGGGAAQRRLAKVRGPGVFLGDLSLGALPGGEAAEAAPLRLVARSVSFCRLLRLPHRRRALLERSEPEVMLALCRVLLRVVSQQLGESTLRHLLSDAFKVAISPSPSLGRLLGHGQRRADLPRAASGIALPALGHNATSSDRASPPPASPLPGQQTARRRSKVPAALSLDSFLLHGLQVSRAAEPPSSSAAQSGQPHSCTTAAACSAPPPLSAPAPGAALPSDAASRAEAAGAMRVIGGDASLRLVGDDSSTSSSEEEEEEGGGGGRSRRSRTWAPRVSITLEEP